MARTNPWRGDPVRRLLDVISRENAYGVLRALLDPEGSKDLAKRTNLPGPRVSETLREMQLIGLVEKDGTAHRIVNPEACWAVLRGAAAAQREPTATAQAALDALDEQYAAWAENRSTTTGDNAGATAGSSG